MGLIVLASAALAGDPATMSVQVKTGQVLDTPSFLGKVITRVNYGDRLQVLEHQGDWSKVTAPDGTSWLDPQLRAHQEEDRDERG